MTVLYDMPRDESEAEIEAVNQRLRSWQHSGDPRFLWPGVDESARIAALNEIERAASAVLCGDPNPVRLGAPDGRDAEAIGIAAFSSSTGPMLSLWVDSGRIGAAPSVAAVLARHLAHGRARAARLERGLESVVDLLAARGIGCTILKGFYTARRYYPEAGARPMSDIDVWLDPTTIPEAERVLREAGWVGGAKLRRPYKRDWHPPDSDQRVRALTYAHAWDPWRLELHGSLDRVFAPGRLARFPRYAGDDEPWAVAGRPVRVLGQPLLLAHLAAHASEEGHVARLLRLIEIVLVSRQDLAAGRLAWADFLSLIRATGTAGFAYPALALAERLAPQSVSLDVLDECASAAGPRVRAFVAHGTPSARTRLEGVSLSEKFLWTSGPVGVMRRVAAMLWPKASASLTDVMRTYARRAYRLRRGRVAIGPTDRPEK